MIETKARIDGMTVFQLIELQKHISARLASLGAPPLTADTGAKFKRGDLIEFYSTRKSRQVHARVERVNGKSLSCHEVDSPAQKWRVPPSMCRLVSADKSAASAPAPSIAPPVKEWAPVKPAAAEPLPAGAGAW